MYAIATIGELGAAPSIAGLARLPVVVRDDPAASAALVVVGALAGVGVFFGARAVFRARRARRRSR